jgi:hypothetical protein
MRTYQAVHWVAIISLSVAAVMNPLGLLLWGFLIWKVWKRPRQWGFGVGILHLLMVAFQSYLRLVVLAEPMQYKHAACSTSTFLLFEIPIIVAGISCVLLKWCHARETVTET